MKRFLLTGAAIIAVSATIGSGVRLVTDHYQTYKSNQTHIAQAAAKRQADEAAGIRQADAARYNDLLGRYNALRAECGKGRNAYDALTPNIQKKYLQPSCPAAILPR